MIALLIVLAQNPPDHTMFEILRQNSSPSSQRFYDRMEAIQQDQYERALEDRLDQQERKLRELEEEKR